MWPWEHVLFAYVFYSLYVHLRYRSRPADWPVAALAFGSLFPDLVDKPLAWQFGFLETGYGIFHSVFFAIPVAILVYAAARYHGTGRVGLGFVFGYLLHLVGDVLPASISRGELYLQPVLWPLWPYDPRHQYGSFADGVQYLLFSYATRLLALDVTPAVALQLGSVVFGTVLWLYDGRPGLRLVTEPINRAVSGIAPE